MTAPTSVPIETLLAQRTWVRQVARALVADEAEADDLEQEVWLRALENRPRDAGAVRSWFRAVLRHKARDLWRGRTRRRRAEEAAPVAPAHVPTADLVAEADAHHRVVDAVMALDEPYRTTIVLRYFHDLAIADVALRTGVPRETARTRLRRGLALLRERFDRESGGDRRTWIAAVLPLTRRATRSMSRISIAASVAASVLVVATLTVIATSLAARQASSVPPPDATVASHSARPRHAAPTDIAQQPPTQADAPDAVDRDGAVAALARNGASSSSTGASMTRTSSSESAAADALTAALLIAHDPGEADEAKLTSTIEVLKGFAAAGVCEGQCRVEIGRCLFRLGRHAEAREALEAGLAVDGFREFTRSWAWLRLGCIADVDGRRSDAEAFYRAVLGLPDAPNLRYAKSRAALFLDRPYAGYAVDR